MSVRSINHGVYGWWFDGRLPAVPRAGCRKRAGKDLLYIGIASPSSQPARSRSPMARRIWRNHLQGTVRTSTLRLSIAALLRTELHLEFFRDGQDRVRMSRQHEVQLSTWLHEHAAISVMQHDDPWSVEKALIEDGPPLPLNLSMSIHSFRKALSELRRSLGRKPTLPG
ncbi:hypothetical protein SAMN05519105_0903 [Rhodobacter sp. 24-YEA-8]|nr:hypothetical protein SAMN05519105_0903 [Rhodobacter sp. 24-YEA-8]